MLLLCALRRSFSGMAASYTILGLKSSAKADEVKKRYYELAKMHHPDLNSSDEDAHRKFADITKAYKNIIDNLALSHYSKPQPQKKPTSERESTYYQSTSEKFKNHKKQKTAAQAEEYDDFFEQDPYFKTNRKIRKPRTGEDIYINATISLKESILGLKKGITFSRNEVCPDCEHDKHCACFTCGGKGEIYDRMQRKKVPCNSCSGRGYENDCSTCHGTTFVVKVVQDSFYIEKGTQDKTIYKIESSGHRGYKSSNGDLYVTVFVEKSDKFRIDGNNVFTEYDLDFKTAVCGGKAQIQTIYGYSEVEIEAGTQSGSQLRIFNAGLKSPYSKRLGDQIVKIKIKIPQKLSQKQKSLFLRLNQESC